MRAPTTGPAMIGRNSDLQVLNESLSAANRGVSRCVAIAGEAGMGKTRLLEEFRATIDPGSLVLSAECIDLGQLGLPFGAVRTILRQLISAVGVDAFLGAAGAGLPAIVALLPELADPSAPFPEGSEPLHEAVLTLLRTFSRDRTIVILLDDAQWADAATLALVHFLLRMISDDRLLAVIAYRSDEVVRTHPLRQLLAELDRARAITRRELRPLDEAEVLELVTSVRETEPASDIVRRIARRSQGIPFYVEELARISGDAIPDNLRDVLLARYGKLDGAVQSFLRTVAVGGMKADHAVLRHVFREADLDGLARPALDEMMLLATPNGYGFRHALVREAVYDELLPGERQATHERYARVLDGLHAPASEISHHWFAARDLTPALRATATAFDEAVATRAFESALQLGERALEIWGKVPDAVELAGRPHASMLAQITDAAQSAGDRNRGIALATAAIAACPPDDSSTRARMLQVLAALTCEEGRPGADALYIEAIELLSGSGSVEDIVRRGRIQIALAVRYQLVGEIDAAHELLVEALATAHESKSDDLLSRALLELGWEALVGGDSDRGRALFAESLTHAGAGEALLIHGNNASDGYSQVGLYREALEVTDRPIARARELGLERTWGCIISNSVEALVGLGRWDEADLRGARVLEIQPSGCAITTQYRRRIVMSHWRDDTARALAVARDHGAAIDAFAAHGDLQDVLPAAATWAEHALFTGELDEAWRQVHVLWDPAHPRATGLDLPLLGLAARTVAEMRRTGHPVPQGAEEQIRATFESLAPLTIVPRWRAFVDAELSGPDHTGTDVAAWLAAVDQLADETMPAHLRAYSRWRLGQAQLAAGDRAGASESLRAASADADQIGALWISHRANELLQTAALGERTHGAGDGLTAREQQVLDLIADGLTNREIAERLYISTKTASVHVSAILRKVGATTRTQAAMRAGTALRDRTM